MNQTEVRLNQIRGAGDLRRHDARTIAALTRNPACARRAVLDAAGVHKQQLADRVGFPAPFGQSEFAIARGITFEAQVKANGCADILRLLRERHGLTIPEVSYHDLETVGGRTNCEARYVRTRQLLAHAARGGDTPGTLFDHPMLRLGVAGRWAYLEPDLVAFQLRDRLHVIEIKSFPAIDGQADPEKVRAAATQSAVYVLALRQMLTELNIDPLIVSHEVFLVCPENFSNHPTADSVDVRKPLTALRTQLARLTRIEEILAVLPDDLTLDLRPDGANAPTRPATELVDALRHIEHRYAPECLSTCEMAYFCRNEARGSTVSLGRMVREELGGVESIPTVIGLATGSVEPAPDQAEAAEVLRLGERLRREALGGAA